MKNIIDLENIYQIFKPRNIAIAAILSVIASAASMGLDSCRGDEKLYLVNIDDLDEGAFKDINGNVIDYSCDSYKKVVGIVSSSKTNCDTDYPVVLVNSAGEMNYGYLNGKYIDDKVIDSISVDDEFIKKMEIDTIMPKNGCWVRKEPIVNTNTDDAELLSKEDDVISSSMYETTADNTYLWKEVVYPSMDLSKLNKGYMANGYILDKDYDKVKERQFTVDIDGLKVRSEASSIDDSNIISMLNKGAIVNVIPNVSSVNKDNIDWLYVAYADDNGNTKAGYVAATVYENGKVINYLVENKKPKVKKQKEKNIMKQVDTSKDNNVSLNMRKNPGVDSETLIKIDNGTIVYTTKSNIQNKIEKDNHEWVKVKLSTGEEGYVAYDYLVDYEIQISNSENPSDTFKFGNEGEINGVFGIDINIGTDSTAVKKLLTNEYTYKDTYGFPFDELTTKPKFLIMKLGATAYSCFQFIPSNVDNINTNLNICEQNGVPFGLYYYSQATTIDEADAEVDNICELLESVNYKNRPDFKLPLYIDVEEQGGDARVCRFGNYEGKKNQAEVINYEMNQLRNRTGLEICLYTDNNTLNSSIDLDVLENINKQNNWVVDVNQAHSDNLIGGYNSYLENTSNRQSDINDQLNVDNIDTWVDFDIMSEEFYKSRVKKH